MYGISKDVKISFALGERSASVVTCAQPSLAFQKAELKKYFKQSPTCGEMVKDEDQKSPITTENPDGSAEDSIFVVDYTIGNDLLASIGSTTKHRSASSDLASRRVPLVLQRTLKVV